MLLKMVMKRIMCQQSRHPKIDPLSVAAPHEFSHACA
jgi:hypothetical protein